MSLKRRRQRRDGLGSDAELRRTLVLINGNPPMIAALVMPESVERSSFTAHTKACETIRSSDTRLNGVI